MRTILLGVLISLGGCGDDDDGPGRGDILVIESGIEYGSACIEDDDCGDVAGGAECCTGGKCSPDGWCSPRCESDQDCPEGFFCVDHDGTRCFMGCADDLYLFAHRSSELPLELS